MAEQRGIERYKHGNFMLLRCTQKFLTELRLKKSDIIGTSAVAHPLLVLATKNKDKLFEIRRLLKNIKAEILSLDDFSFCEEVEETGKTFEANAKLKARYYSRQTKSLVVADDSGLMVNALNAKPGVYSARFAGKNCTYRDNNRKLLRLLKGFSDFKRKAKFVCAIAIYDNGKFIKTLRGECAGKISRVPKGQNGFGYDPVFIPAGFSKTFAELSSATKNKISHRGKALRKAAQFLVRLTR